MLASSKRGALVAAGVLFLLQTSGETQSRAIGTGWTCSLDDLADSPTLCISAPEPGMRRYITDIIAQSTKTTGGVLQLVHNKSVATGGSADCGGAVTSAIFPAGIEVGRFAAAANTLAPMTVRLRTPIVVPTGRDLCAYGDPTNTASLQLIGYVGP